MDRLQLMTTFVRVIEAGSFTAAARALRVGQPAVSKAISGLEDHLGVRLIVRSTRRLAPTEAGQMFYERARLALSEVDETWVAVKDVSAGLDGRLRVCAPVTFARLHVVPRLGSFLDAHPKLRLDLVLDDRPIDLLQEGIDIALRLGTLADSSLTARKISSAPRLVVASRRYLERYGEPRRPSDLLSHQAIIYAQGAGGDEWRFKKGTSETSVRIQSRLSFTAAEGLREAVLAGFGIAIVSRWMMAPELMSGAVMPVLTAWTLPAMDLWAMYPAGRLPSAKARSFTGWLEQALTEAYPLDR